WYAVGVGDPYGAYALNASVNQTYLVPGADTLWLATEVFNPDSQTVEVRAMIESFDQTILDTIPMFDDGLHQDSTAGDNLFGGSWSVPSGEKLYKVHISTFSSDTSYYNILRDAAHFTTIGPVVFDGYTVTSNPIPDVYTIQLNLRNNGSVATANQITAFVATSDTNVQGITGNPRPFGDIAAGQTAQSVGGYNFFIPNVPPSIDVSVDIFSEGYHLWSDNFSMTITGIAESDATIPEHYALKQNHPNPFNPSTTIEYQLPRAAEVKLAIYNVLGQKVRTLVNGKLAPGYHSVVWDGRDDRGVVASSG
ncbi:MAG: hypothetical protein GWN30_13475, partial [Gammaproteobacteria bacterium]|nr:hypothetical protein [Gammaproteobacteria bacterium]NIX01407.1 hypothetical protein [Phycisphaerae bacterium]